MKYSIRNILVATVFVCLVAALFVSRQEISRLKVELSRAMPFREIEVLSQVEEQAAKMGIPVEATEILFDQTTETYIVVFRYVHPIDRVVGDDKVTLTKQGSNNYIGYIRAEPFLRDKPDENGELGRMVVVSAQNQKSFD